MGEIEGMGFRSYEEDPAVAGPDEVDSKTDQKGRQPFAIVDDERGVTTLYTGDMRSVDQEVFTGHLKEGQDGENDGG